MKDKETGRRGPKRLTDEGLDLGDIDATIPSKAQKGFSSHHDKLRLPKAAELIAQNLRNRIIRGQLAEGEMLPSERELVEQFGTSRPTLREAIRILESERLVAVSRGIHGGAKVLKPSADVAARYVELILQSRGTSLADVYRTRVLIEPAAARVLAKERRPEAIIALRNSVKAIRSAGKSKENGLAFSHFHRVLIEQTRVETLILLMGMLNTVLDHYLVAVSAVLGQYVEGAADLSRAIKAQEQLIDLIESGESDAAAESWRRYLRQAENKLRQWQPAELVVDLLQN